MDCRCCLCLILACLSSAIVIVSSCSEKTSAPELPRHEPRWSQIESPTSYDLNDAWGANDNCIFAVGSNGTILHFNGSEWDTTNTLWNNFQGVWGSSASSVYAVGNYNSRVAHYNGTNWISMQGPDFLRSVWGSAGNAIYAVGNDGNVAFYNGTAWQNVAGPAIRDLYGVWGSAENSVYTVGESGLIFNYNGTTWNPMSFGAAQCLMPSDAAMVIQSIDGPWVERGPCHVMGQERIYSFLFEYDIQELFSLQPSEIKSVELDIEYSRPPENGPGEGMSLAYYLNGADGEIMVGDILSGTLYSSNICDQLYNGTIHVDVQDALRAAMNGSKDYIGFRIESNDYYGYTLESCVPSMIVTLESLPPLLRSIWGSSKDDVYAVGTSGTIIHFNGLSWTKMDSGTVYDLNDIWGFSAGDIFAVGANGKIIHYDGHAWTNMESGTTTNLNAIWGRWPTNIYVFGEDGLIMRYH